MHLLDTDTLTCLHAGHHGVVQHLQELDHPVVGTTIITRIEIMRGQFDFVLKADTGADLIRAQQLLARTEELLSQILVIPFDEIAASRFDHLRTMKGIQKIGRADLLIASILSPTELR